ncbi:hypothetical protein CEXT_122011 [Caerostris extrusa]|uniref:Secreted protein n=1 Tax=Caerostris extrusa TaxID=172846 RepID=A0AAV4VYQ9_CAEEX|nr:hypothetical protein CEXT_122011 [Caerostris extrusa]
MGASVSALLLTLICYDHFQTGGLLSSVPLALSSPFFKSEVNVHPSTSFFFFLTTSNCRILQTRWKTKLGFLSGNQRLQMCFGESIIDEFIFRRKRGNISERTLV